jgi:hypothetical protein
VGGFIDRLIAKDIVMIFYALWLLRKVMALRESEVPFILRPPRVT